MKKSPSNLAVAALLIFCGAGMLLPGMSSATLELESTAKEKGFPAKDCRYCHQGRNPRKEMASLNARGEWLVAERDRRFSRQIDPAWLRFYPNEPKPKHAKAGSRES